MHLHIGEGIVTTGNLLVSTVLGSCVSVTFFHAESGLAGIFHAMLPLRGEFADAAMPPCKYVDSAIDVLYEQFVRRGIAVRDVEIKLFGGAFSLGKASNVAARALVDVGARNVATARQELARRRLRVAGEQVLGDRGRKLLFDTRSGVVWVKLLASAEEQAVLRTENVEFSVATNQACRLEICEP